MHSSNNVHIIVAIVAATAATDILRLVVSLRREVLCSIKVQNSINEASFSCSFRYTSDAQAAMFVALLLFCLPRNLPAALIYAGNDSKYADAHLPLLSWRLVERHLSWGTIMLLGGGYAMADGVSVRMV